DALVQTKPLYAMSMGGRGSSFENRREGDRIIQDVARPIRNNQYNAFAAADMPDAPAKEFHSELPKESAPPQPKQAAADEYAQAKAEAPARADTSSGAGIIQVPMPRKRERTRHPASERRHYY